MASRKAGIACLATALVGMQIPCTLAADWPGTIEDASFSSQLGSPGPGALAAGAALPHALAAGFAGATVTPCSAMDLHRFLQAFDPRELLDELRQSLIDGAQSALSNYLLALAYSAPTLVSVLDMTDKTLNTRFTAFARSCAMQRADALAPTAAPNRLARAAQQCFAAELARGAAPTDAMRRCSQERRFDGLTLPATLPTLEFVRRYTFFSLTPRLQGLLNLLPDARIQDGGYQVRPAPVGVASLTDNWQAQARLALDLIDGGTQSSAIPTCELASIVNGRGTGCLPASAMPLVNSPAYRSTRLLEPSARSILKDALAGQIAVVQVYSDLLELRQQIDSIGLRGDTDATAEEILARQHVLQRDAGDLLVQADLRVKLQESKVTLARMQLLALQRAQADLHSQAASLSAQQRRPGSGVLGLLRIFLDRN